MTCPCPICTESRLIRAEVRAERVASAMWWLGRAVRRLAGIDPFPTERSN